MPQVKHSFNFGGNGDQPQNICSSHSDSSARKDWSDKKTEAENLGKKLTQRVKQMTGKARSGALERGTGAGVASKGATAKATAREEPGALRRQERREQRRPGCSRRHLPWLSPRGRGSSSGLALRPARASIRTGTTFANDSCSLSRSAVNL